MPSFLEQLDLYTTDPLKQHLLVAKALDVIAAKLSADGGTIDNDYQEILNAITLD